MSRLWFAMSTLLLVLFLSTGWVSPVMAEDRVIIITACHPDGDPVFWAFFLDEDTAPEDTFPEQLILKGNNIIDFDETNGLNLSNGLAGNIVYINNTNTSSILYGNPEGNETWPGDMSMVGFPAPFIFPNFFILRLNGVVFFDVQGVGVYALGDSFAAQYLETFGSGVCEPIPQ